MAGPGPVLYLDVDDEITSAAARVRAAEGTRVALVVPPGSRIATSRINFRLLARDAGVHGRRLAIIAPDAASRALAAAAGLEVFVSVAEYEAAMGGAPTTGATGAPPPSGAAGRSGAPAAAAVGAAGLAAATRPTLPPTPPGTPNAGGVEVPKEGGIAGTGGAPVLPPPSGSAGGADDLRPRSAAATAPAGTGGTRRRRGIGGRGLFIVLAILLGGVLVVGGVAGYLLLPSATIVVTPKVETIGPVEVTVTADAEATEVDASAAVVPAERLPLDVQAEGTYKATGERVVETTATGTVRWTNCDPTDSYTIASGTVVKTRGGVAFATTDSVFLPVAILELFDLKCQSKDIGIEAVDTGTTGNVPADTITVVPPSLNSIVIRVTNRAPTTGGTRETFPRITAEDVAAAQADLGAQLEASFAALVADPATAPQGTTLFPETAVLGEPVWEGDPATLVDQEIAEFTMSATASGTVIAVDESPIEAVVESSIEGEVDEGYVLVEGSVKVRVGEPEVDGETVIFPATVTALQSRVLDPDELETLVLGMTPDEASEALAPYGRAAITLTPDWATTIPTWSFRVDLTVETTPEATPPASPRSSPTPKPSPTPKASPLPTSPSPSPS